VLIEVCGESGKLAVGNTVVLAVFALLELTNGNIVVVAEAVGRGVCDPVIVPVVERVPDTDMVMDVLTLLVALKL
jgi:hypothetical protein